MKNESSSVFRQFYKQRNLGNLLKTRNSYYWDKVAEKETLKLFYSVAHYVPAYKDFLKKNRIDPKKISTIKDFSFVPAIDKNNYLKAYPYEKLVWDGDLKKAITIHSTSGSTGEPTYFQKQILSDLRREFIIDRFFKNNALTLEGPTLFIITFSMGIWSAGMGIYTATYLAINLNNYPISVVTPGINKIETIKILRNIAPNFKQIIIAGYPPFVKDIIDDALQEGINLKKINMRFIFTGETFSEEFRDYIASKCAIKNIYSDTMNTYGTSEFGATAVETPLGIFVRRISKKNLFNDLFGGINKVPTLAQYVPNFVNIECVNGGLFFTGNNTVPLIKYRSGDNGGIFSFRQLKEILYNNDIDVKKECIEAGVQIQELPFVFVYERKNLTVTLYGVLIYPEFIKSALLSKDLNSLLTGKFTMMQKYDKNQNQYLEINLELRKAILLNKNKKNIAIKKMVEILKEKSSEFAELEKNLGSKVHPKLVFWPYEYQEYFMPGLKQKWVKKL